MDEMEVRRAAGDHVRAIAEGRRDDALRYVLEPIVPRSEGPWQRWLIR